MDPITIATATSAVTLLANEAVKGAASELGKDAWARIKALFGWPVDPPVSEVPALTAKSLETSPELLEKLLDLLKQSGNETAGQLVGTIHADKVIVAQHIGSVQM